jgi:hypothetical protein
LLDAARVSSLPLRISLAFTDIINVKNKGIYIYINSGAGTAYPSGAPDFTPVLGGVPVIRYLVLYVYLISVNAREIRRGNEETRAASSKRQKAD